MVFIFLISGLLLLAAFLYIISWRRHPKNSRPKNLLSLPQPPQVWPILGHLHLLGGDAHTCLTFSKLADKYGPVFSLRLGFQHAVVISDRRAVMEAFTVRDKSFANRPRNSSGEHLVYDNAAIGFANGVYWRDMRKLVLTEVLSTRSMEKMRNLRVSEIDTSIKELYFQAVRNQNKPVNLSQWTEQMTLNIIVKTLAGKRYGSNPDGSVPEEVSIFRRLISDITNLTAQFVLSDVIPFPFLKWLDPKGYIKRMKKVSEELDGILEVWIDEHLRRRSRGGEVGSDEPDFVDVLLSNIDDRLEKIHGKAKMIIIKATLVNVILGGFDTTSVFLSWALSLLLQHKEAMNLAQKEIDSKIGKQRWVQESDLKNLVYLQAIVKETLRLYPSLPLSVPHEAAEDSELCGYFVPKGAFLFVNLWKLHRDPQFWPEPEEFHPERFLSGQAAQMDVHGQQFEYTPFGSGRRVCPGITFVAHVGNLTLARLLQGFDLVTPGDQKVDMSVGFGVTIPRANPLEVLITPRLHTKLYES